MKLAISNIAWQKQEDESVYRLMKEYGFTGLEIAPTRVLDNPYEQPAESINSFKDSINKQGIELVAMQALLFGQPDLKIFADNETRAKTLNYLKNCISFAAKSGIKVLVFGSPKNRIIGELNRDAAMSTAVAFFSELGDFAAENNVYFCIEPNPVSYGTDFMNTTGEALEFVKLVDNKGFRLHMDMGTVIINQEDCQKVIEKAVDYLAHFHISEPFLELISDTNKEFHQKAAEALKDVGYQGWVSIEMKNGIKESNIEAVKQSLDYSSRIYK